MQEIWKPIPGFEGLYEASSLGRIKSLEHVVTMPNGITKKRYKERILKFGTRQDGRFCVNLCKDCKPYHFKVHRLIALAFLGPKPEGLETCHNDGNCQNNRIENLRYDTIKNNALDRIKHGTTTKGEKSNLARINQAIANEMRLMRSEGVRAIVIARHFGVSHATVYRVLRNELWITDLESCRQ